MSVLYYLSQYFSTQLSVVGGIDASQTTGVVLQSVTGINDTTKPGIALLNYADPLNESIAEWVTFTSINSTTKTLVGVTRGAEKGSGKTHSNGVTVAFPISESHINNIIQHFTDIKTEVQTLTNKRITKRVTSIVSNANPTINTDNCDVVDITAQAAAIASMTTNLSGTPTNFQGLIVRIKDDGTARAITWGASFEARGTALPTTTVISKVLTAGFLYDTTTSKWGCIASAQEA